MSCVEPIDIRRYVQGAMDDREADAVTRHLVSCKRCRQSVAEVRGTTDPKAVPAMEGQATTKRDERELVKVRCQQCGARYGIPADRVRGRMLKIRCKNCSSIIEVWSAEGAVKSVIDRGKKLWFLVIKRQRMGPMTGQEVRERFGRGEIKARTYAWRQGFTKWERLHDIPEFKDLGGLTPRISSQPTRKAPAPSQLDPDRTEKARPPRAYIRATERSSEELNFDQERLDSLADTAYRDGGAEDDSAPGSLPDELGSGTRTAYVPKDAAPATDNQLTHIHLAQREPVEGLELGEGLEHEATSTFDAESEASWDRQFRNPAAPAPERPDPRIESGEWERHMKGQRRENSVLFSLGHLQSLASAQAPKAGRRPEGSNPGLFDIRPTIGPPASALMIPEEPRTRRKVGMFLGVALLGIVLGAGVLLGILYLVQPQLVKALVAGKKLEVVAEGRARGTLDSGSPLLASNAGSDAQPTATGPDAAPVLPRDVGAADMAPAGPDLSAAPARTTTSQRGQSSKRSRRRRSRPNTGGIEVVDPDADDAVEPAATPAAPEPPDERAKPAAPDKPRPKAGGADLDRLIEDATGPGEVRKKKAPAPEEGGAPGAGAAAPQLPKTLSREQVAAGMRLAEPGVRACYQQLREPGLVMISATINGATGRIGAARAVGGFAGTPSGQCVVLAVRRSCVFPRFSGPPLTLKYPYMMR